LGREILDGTRTLADAWSEIEAPPPAMPLALPAPEETAETGAANV
jgi:hypothetical protein